MKYSAIFCAVMIALVLTGSSFAQTSGQRLTFSESIDPTGKDVVLLSYSAFSNPGLPVIYEGVVIGSVDNCFDNYNLSNVKRVSPDRASMTFDPATGTHTVKWVLKRDNTDTCRVLFGSDSGRVDAADYVVWRKTDGTALYEGIAKSDEPGARSGDGSVRGIRHSVSLNVWY